MARDSGHLDRLDADYRRLRRMGFTAVRESLGWRLCDSAGRFNFQSLHARMQAAQRQRIEIRWTLMHYGTPADIDLLDGDDEIFVERFARFCRATAAALRHHPHATPRIAGLSANSNVRQRHRHRFPRHENRRTSMGIKTPTLQL